MIGTISFNPFMQYGYVDVGHVFFLHVTYFQLKDHILTVIMCMHFFWYKYACRIFFFKVTNQPP